VENILHNKTKAKLITHNGQVATNPNYGAKEKQQKEHIKYQAKGFWDLGKF